MGIGSALCTAEPTQAPSPAIPMSGSALGEYGMSAPRVLNCTRHPRGRDVTADPHSAHRWVPRARRAVAARALAAHDGPVGLDRVGPGDRAPAPGHGRRAAVV